MEEVQSETSRMHPFLKNKFRVLILVLSFLLLCLGETLILFYLNGESLFVAITEALIENIFLGALVYSLWYWLVFGGSDKQGITSKLFTPIVSLLVLTLLWKGVTSVFTILITGDKFPEFDQEFASKTFYGFLVFLVFFFIYLYDEFKSFSDQRNEEEKQLELKAQKAELRFLRAQLNPHFLFNSLNSVASLTQIDPDKAHDTVIRLSDYLRYSLKLGRVLSVPLSQELESIKLYLSVESIRYEDQLQLETKIQFDNDIKVPSMITQALVENAIKFGVESNDQDSKIDISVYQEEECIVFKISNDFNDSSPFKEGEGIGLINVRERMYLHYQRRDLVEIESNDSKFEVTLKFPI